MTWCSAEEPDQGGIHEASMDVAAWLHDLGRGQCEQACRENDNDVDVLAELTADDLIGVDVTSVGHRRKLFAAIAALRSGTAPTLPPDPGTPASISPMASPLPEAERRQVAVLFADLAGYTKFADKLDAWEVSALLRSFFDLATPDRKQHASLRPVGQPPEPNHRSNLKPNWPITV